MKYDFEPGKRRSQVNARTKNAAAFNVRGGTLHMKGVGMLVGNFELHP